MCSSDLSKLCKVCFCSIAAMPSCAANCQEIQDCVAVTRWRCLHLCRWLLQQTVLSVFLHNCSNAKLCYRLQGDTGLCKCQQMALSASVLVASSVNLETVYYLCFCTFAALPSSAIYCQETQACVAVTRWHCLHLCRWLLQQTV